MILLLPLWELNPPSPPTCLQYFAGHPRLWWVIQSYDQMASLVIAIIHPAHLQAGIQTHLPRSTAISIASSGMQFQYESWVPIFPLIEAEELLIADPLTPYENALVKRQLAILQLSADAGSIGNSIWWKKGRHCIEAIQRLPRQCPMFDLLPGHAMRLALAERVIEPEDAGLWQSQAEWR